MKSEILNIKKYFKRNISQIARWTDPDGVWEHLKYITDHHIGIDRNGLWKRYPDNWQILRNQILKRDGYRCRICGRTHHLQVHHIIPLSRGGSNDPSNLITLCVVCHAAQHPGNARLRAIAERVLQEEQQ